MAALPMAANANPDKVPATYRTAYVPDGYDANDHVQIVGEGVFKNSCYRPAETTVKVDAEKKQIVLGPAAYQYGGFCLQLVLPFDRVVDVGVVPAGTYQVIQSPDNTVIGQFTVKPNLTESPDEYLYAPVQQAFFKQKGAKVEVALTGEFPNSCMKLKETRLEVQPKALVVLPIAEMEERGDCQNGSFPFSKIVSAELVKPGRYLLHVRSMNAKAVNTLVDVK